MVLLAPDPTGIAVCISRGEERMYIAGLNGLRAIAIILVFIDHFTPWGKAHGTGSWGVWLFLALSGYLITNKLIAQRRRVENGSSIGNELTDFTAKRAFRIWPAYFLVLATMIPISAVAHKLPFSALGVLAHVAFASNWYIAAQGHWINQFSHLWTLAIEQQFYVVASVLILCLPAVRARWVCASFVLCALVMGVGLAITGVSDIARYVDSIVNFGFLGLGGVAATLVAPREGKANWPGALLAVFVALPALVSPHAVLTSQFCGLLATPIAVGLIVNQRSTIVRLLDVAPLRWMGEISYSFYLIHNFVRPPLLEAVLSKMRLPAPDVVTIPAVFLLSIALASASYLFIEGPVRRWGASMLSRRANETASLSALQAWPDQTDKPIP